MKHKHAELIKAWADGAKIQFQYSHGGWDMASFPSWSYDKKYRIKPDCEYAIEEIHKLGGDEAVELYKHWLGGGELEISGDCPVSGKILDDVKPAQEDPFKEFIGIPLGLVSKKKQTVKQVLWIGVAVIRDSVVLQSLWLNKGNRPTENDFCKYHIAPGYEGGIEL